MVVTCFDHKQEGIGNVIYIKRFTLLLDDNGHVNNVVSDAQQLPVEHGYHAENLLADVSRS